MRTRILTALVLGAVLVGVLLFGPAWSARRWGSWWECWSGSGLGRGEGYSSAARALIFAARSRAAFARSGRLPSASLFAAP